MDTTESTDQSPRRRASQRKAQFEQRCQRFVEVAEELFLSHGFAGTSVNKVVAIAGGSLATLYAEFRNKDELFEAVMKRRAARLFAAMVTPGTEGGLQAILDSMARRMLDHMLSDEALSVYRLVITEGPRFPAVRNAVLQNGWDPFLNNLASQFKELADRYGWAVADTRVAAELFLTLVQGQTRTLAAWGFADRFTPEQRAADAKRAVQQFLKVYPLTA
ncbi:MAG: TetR/AcrR family transcriptional regulator [Burkholderiales bacterium]|nr:TetR/AcrR family transcriptional regulator [Burkholderiales bacterium]